MEEFKAIAVMDKVRAHFAKGHKSDNKRYYVDRSGQLEADLDTRFSETQIKKFNHRFEQSKRARENAPQFRTENRKLRAEWTLINVNKTSRSGNCDEMGTLSAYFAHEDHRVPLDQLYFVKVTEPGDHGFCLVARKPIPPLMRRFNSVTEFTQAESARTWLVIDPWLHVCCFAHMYLWHGEKQLEGWGGKGKRIRWEHGSVGNGWYEPNGEYKTKFAVAPVALLEYASDNK